MATFLLLWNPRRWLWDDLAEMSRSARLRGSADGRWSCAPVDSDRHFGNNRHIAVGDRVFLLRVGVEPRGIMASGAVTQGSYPVPHWDEHKPGRVTQCIDIRWDALLHPEQQAILPRAELNHPRFSPMHWNTQSSGIRIPDGVAFELERTWLAFRR
jgi:5-methylcytosine-specific restriction enzyme A